MDPLSPPGTGGQRKPTGGTGHSQVHEHQEKGAGEKGLVAPIEPTRMLPQSDHHVLGQPLHERNTAIAGQTISPEMQKHLDDFSLNGSASALLSLLNSQTGLNGQFQIVFQPNGGGQPIPFEQFQQHPDIYQAYQNIKQQIAQNHQSIAYGLTCSMAMQQQQMAMLAMQQQQMQSVNMALMQALMHPVVQPMAVPLDYLLGFKGAQIPQQNSLAMGWGGVPGAAAPQPGWAPYPQHMLMAQPGLQQPFAHPAPQQAGFCAMPAAPPQAGMGFQVPFSPWGWYAQQNPHASAGYAQQLQQFAQAPAPSLIPSWVWQPPIVINNKNVPQQQRQANPAPNAGGNPAINVEVNPVINNGLLGNQGHGGEAAASNREFYRRAPAGYEGYDNDHRDWGGDRDNGDLRNQLRRARDYLDGLGGKPADDRRLKKLEDDLRYLKNAILRDRDKELDDGDYDGFLPRGKLRVRRGTRHRDDPNGKLYDDIEDLLGRIGDKRGRRHPADEYRGRMPDDIPRDRRGVKGVDRNAGGRRRNEYDPTG